MKRQKNKNKKKSKGEKRFWIIFMIIIVLLVLGTILLCLFSDSDKIITYEKPNTIKVYADENSSDADNLKEVHLANVYVVDGELYEEIINESKEVELALLAKTLQEIKEGKINLTLTVEPQLGLIQAVEISKNDPNYIYAVAEYLPFRTETVYTSYIPKEVLSGANCSNLYDQIDTDLQNANYCNLDSDCETLPLAGPYIEFGCYHYINKEENSSRFYDRMNYYSAECGDVIDLCRQSPEPRCVDKECVEAE
ncbi:MAG: hypothetical protein NTX24_03590 [Candidatus Pacearchaeota archaeon]|nr:hypothetical protein [Candidatus Pacearchaeota archaeon]